MDGQHVHIFNEVDVREGQPRLEWMEREKTLVGGLAIVGNPGRQQTRQRRRLTATEKSLKGTALVSLKDTSHAAPADRLPMGDAATRLGAVSSEATHCPAAADSGVTLREYTSTPPSAVCGNCNERADGVKQRVPLPNSCAAGAHWPAPCAGGAGWKSTQE